MKIAAAYLRVSTDRQDEYSLDSQLKLIREYASKNDMIVPEEFVFCDDGISGRSAEKRPEFQRMIANAKSKAFEIVLVWKFSRFARNQEESIVYKSMLHRVGVEVISISEPLIEGPFGSLIERILEWMDEFYSIRLAGEVKRGMTEKVSRGEPVTKPSFGYDIENKNYVPNSDAPIVQKIYEDYVSGKPVSVITRELGLQGVRTYRGNIPDHRFVDYILTNPVYIGKIRWSASGPANYQRGGESKDVTLVDGSHEHIISDELWTAAQERRERQNRGRLKYERREQPVDWMLKGLVRCGDCGSTLVRSSLPNCASMQCYKYAHAQCAVSHSLSIAKANRLIIAGLENYAELGVFPLAPQAIKHEDGPDYDQLLRTEEAKLRRVLEAYEAGIDTLEEYKVKKTRLTTEINKIKKQAAEAQKVTAARIINPEEYKNRVLKVLEIIKDENQSEKAKNTALKSIISYIVYDKPNNRLAIYFYN